MMTKTDILGESLKDLCAAQARLVLDFTLAVQKGEKVFLERLQTAEINRNLLCQRAHHAEAETAELLEAAHELEREANIHHGEMLKLRRQLYKAQSFIQTEESDQGKLPYQQQPLFCVSKKLNLKSFLETVDQIRAFKAKADAKARSTSSDTMEQCMYSFLRERHRTRAQKY